MGESAAPRAQPERQRHHARQWLTRRRVLGMLRLALLPFFRFEVGIRLVPPDLGQASAQADVVGRGEWSEAPMRVRGSRMGPFRREFIRLPARPPARPPPRPPACPPARPPSLPPVIQPTTHARVRPPLRSYDGMRRARALSILSSGALQRARSQTTGG